jgi:hypothetical protein
VFPEETVFVCEQTYIMKTYWKTDDNKKTELKTEFLHQPNYNSVTLRLFYCGKNTELVSKIQKAFARYPVAYPVQYEKEIQKKDNQGNDAHFASLPQWFC